MNRVKLASTKKGIENFISGSLIEVRPMSVDKLQGLRCKVATVDEWLSSADAREDVIGAIEQGASKAVQGMLSSVSTSISNGKTLTTPGMESVMKSLADIVTKKATEINNSVTTMMKGVATTIRNSSPSVQNATRTAFSNAVNVLNGMKGQFENAGQNAGQGFVNGINSKMGASTVAGRNLGLAALNAAKKALDSHSPSREFIYLGENMGEGLAIGAENSIVPASQATSKMIGEVLKVSSKGIEAFQKCQRRGDFVVFRRTENVEKWRVKVYSLWIIILAVFACQA